MDRFKRLMVALDFSEMDEVLIKYTAFFANIVKPEKIYFIHIRKELDLPDELIQELNGSEDSIDEQLEDKMRKEVIRHFPRVSGYDMDYDVELGDPFKNLLRWSEVKKVDLVIAGRKKELKGSGLVVSHLTRTITCSLLLVPESAEHKMNRFMVPVDFSENSALACNVMNELYVRAHGEYKELHHVFTLPSGYYRTGKSEEEFAEIMKGHAQKKAHEFCEEQGMDEEKIAIHYSLDDNMDPTDKIMDEAHEQSIDLIVIGARGRTETTSFLLGSTTEKLINRDNDIPILIVKGEEKSMSFLEMLKSI